MTPERREDGPLTWRDALGPSDEREEAAGIIEELLDAVGIGVQARAHAADLVTRLRATPVADTAGIDAATLARAEHDRACEWRFTHDWTAHIAKQTQIAAEYAALRTSKPEGDPE